MDLAVKDNRPTHTHWNRKSASNGFTLIEVVIATFIVLFGMAGAMSMSVWQLRATQFNERSSEATAAGQRQLERFIQQEYSDIGNGSRTDAPFELSWTSTVSNRFKIVNLEISWDTSKTTHTITMRDLFPDDTVDGYIVTD